MLPSLFFEIVRADTLGGQHISLHFICPRANQVSTAHQTFSHQIKVPDTYSGRRCGIPLHLSDASTALCALFVPIIKMQWLS